MNGLIGQKESFTRNSPNGWIVVNLGEFVDNEKGKKPKHLSKNKTEKFSIPYVDIQAFERGIIGNYTDGEGCRLCDDIDFLLVWDGSRSGLVGKAISGAVGSTLARLRFPGIFNDYAYYFLKSKYLQINTRTKGTGTPHVDPDLLWNYEFPIPPLPEQYRIVDKIEELFSDLDNAIESLKKAKEQLKTYRQSVLKWAFEGKLTEEWRKQNNPEPAEKLLERIKEERERHYQEQLESWKQEVKKWEQDGKKGRKPSKPNGQKITDSLKIEEMSNLPEIPLKWIYIKMEEVSDFITKGTTPSKSELFDNQGDIPFIKVYNLTHTGKLDFSINPTYVSRDTHEGFLSRSKVYPGDVLMNIVGPPLGKVSLIPQIHKEWNINQAIVRYRPYSGIYNKYLMYYLLSDTTLSRMTRMAKATAGQFNLTLEICRDLEIPVCTIKEQEIILQEIESRLSVCDNIEANITETMDKSEALRQSILKKAFEGKLVPQDPDDEPAWKLLERIKAEKEDQQIRIKL